MVLSVGDGICLRILSSFIFEEIKMIGEELGGEVLSRSVHVMDDLSLPPSKGRG